ncbi:hypothetical protein [Marinifilum flexuosum]|uniref:hypothetical protein n=1 Tax=Marinifilum flexuosum TaxID=1117708 RepID=UPI00248F8E55|nr:hypothetical protein [Marinifilum flexuosum]
MNCYIFTSNYSDSISGLLISKLRLTITFPSLNDERAKDQSFGLSLNDERTKGQSFELPLNDERTKGQSFELPLNDERVKGQPFELSLNDNASKYHFAFIK